MGFGWTEMLLIFGVILLIFGPKKLPELARNLGSSINVFKEEVSKEPEKLEDAVTGSLEEDSPSTEEESTTTRVE